MSCNIELANAQLKLWDYKLLESVHTPIYSPNSSDHDAVQAVDTFTYSYFRLAPARHKVRLESVYIHIWMQWFESVYMNAMYWNLNSYMNAYILNSYMNAYIFTINWQDGNSSLDEGCIDVQDNGDQNLPCSYSKLGQLKWNGTIGVTSKDPVTIPLYEFIYELHVLFRHERAQKVFFTYHHWNSYTLWNQNADHLPIVVVRKILRWRNFSNHRSPDAWSICGFNVCNSYLNQESKLWIHGIQSWIHDTMNSYFLNS